MKNQSAFEINEESRQNGVNGHAAKGLVDGLASEVATTNQADSRKALNWVDFLVTEKPEEVKAFLSIGPAPVWTQGNHSLLIGKKKSRKTLFIVWLIGQYLKQGGGIDDVLICDTEQGLKHVWNVRDRVHRMTDCWVKILHLRGRSIEERKTIIEQAVTEGKFKVVVIDGIRDLLSNINDADQCSILINYIERLTTVFQLHIVNILHQNKTDNNARGHLGTELLNKAEITIELELDERAGCTLVKCESARDVPFDSFAFTHNADDLPEIVSVPSRGEALTDDERKNRLQFVFEANQIHYKEVIEGIKTHFKVGENKAGQLLGEFIRLGWIVKNGKDRSPDTVYKLMATGSKHQNSTI